jgi:hypothetical protein
MSMVLVDSSSIRAVGYDGYTLAVQFRSSDTIYTHPGVPYSVYLGLLRAGSKGRYYSHHIRGRYR